ncbi:MAG: extracellular solute-binding protein [Eubacteriales bacterium]|nr:extracellular solute-binding protein [Eubacteriales bacterium]
MKKLALFLVLTMLVGIVGASAMADTQMTVAWWGNQTRNERTQAALDLYAEQNAGMTFDVQMNAWADYWAALATASAGGSLPDVIQMDYQYLSQYVQNNLLVDLTPYVTDGTLDIAQVNEGITGAGSIDGGLYAICLGVNAPSLLYNKTLLDANGITVKDNMTMDEFIALSKEIFEKTGYKTNIGYGTDMVFDYMLRGLGHSLFTDGKVSATQEDAEYYFGLYEQGIKEGWHVGSEIFAEVTIGSVEQDPMIYGSDPANMSWCAFFWSNQMTAMQAAAPEGMEIGVTTWPSADPIKSNYLKPSQFFSVSAQGQNQAEAVKVVNFFLNSTECNDILLAERGIPAAANVAAAVAPKLDEINQKVVAYINDVVTPNCSAVPNADPAGATELFAYIDELREQLCYGAITAQEAAAAFVEEAASIIK